jgi:hypothetical protein
MAEAPGQIELRDPLSEVTRAERKILLLVSTVAVLIVKGDIVPSKIEALGIEFSDQNQATLVRGLGLVVAYFVSAFVVYAASDFLSWRLAVRNALIDWHRERQRLPEEERRLPEELRHLFRTSFRLLYSARTPAMGWTFLARNRSARSSRTSSTSGPHSTLDFLQESRSGGSGNRREVLATLKAWLRWGLVASSRP